MFSSMSQTSLENLSKFQPSGKRSSSSSLSLDPSHTKKQAICSDNFSVSQKAIGGNSSPHPPPWASDLRGSDRFHCLAIDEGP